MNTLIFLNGQFLKGEEAKIPALDMSILRGFGVMDYFRTYNGQPFRLRDHLERFIASATEIELVCPHTIEELEFIPHELIKRAGFAETSIKVILTGGCSADQYLPEGPPTFFAVAYPMTPFPRKYYEKGIKVITDCYARPFPTAKTTHYLQAIMSMKRAVRKGATDVLFYNEKGELLESGTANLFALKNGKLLTPKEGILKGITRQVILELFPAEECVLYKEEIHSFEGLFLASSNKEIMPIVQVDEILINQGMISKVIQDMMKTFAEYTHSVPSSIFV